MRDCYRVKCGQLDNGLRFYTQHDSGSSREMAIICVMTGSVHGIGSHMSHLVEHCICNELPDVSQEELDFILWRTTGGPDDLIYITTSHSVTTYGVGNCIKKRHNRLIFPLFAEIVKKPIVSEDTFLLEKAAIHQEHFLRGKDASVEHLARDLLLGAVYPANHPAHEAIDGSMEKVRSATIVDILDHHRKYYVPANTFVVFFGPTHQEVRGLVEQEFGDWGNNTAVKKNRLFGFTNSREKARLPIRASTEKHTTRVGIHQYQALIGFPTDNYLSPDAEALDVIARILAGRMYHELRSKNRDWDSGAYRTPVFTHRSFAHGLLGFHFATLNKSFLERGVEIFYRQCDDFCKQLVHQEELTTHVGYIYDYEFIDDFHRGPGNLSEMVIIAVANGDLDLTHLHNRGERLRALTRHQLREVAKKYLTGPSAKLIISPK